jgi:anti-sigma B factor antagonist
MVESTSEGSSRFPVEFDDGAAQYAVAALNGNVEVRMGGEVDLASVAAHTSVLAHVEELLETDAAPVVVSMSDVTFCDSTGLALLLRLSQLAEDAGAPFVLREVSAAVQRVVDAAGLHDLGADQTRDSRPSSR